MGPRSWFLAYFLLALPSVLAYETLSGTIDSSFTLESGTTYFVDGEVTINGSDMDHKAVLSIKPAAIVKFKLGNGKLVFGEHATLAINGSETDPPIVFTSECDNVGDEVTDCSPSPGDYPAVIEYHEKTLYGCSGGGSNSQTLSRIASHGVPIAYFDPLPDLPTVPPGSGNPFYRDIELPLPGGGGICPVPVPAPLIIFNADIKYARTPLQSDGQLWLLNNRFSFNGTPAPDSSDYLLQSGPNFKMVLAYNVFHHNLGRLQPIETYWSEYKHNQFVENSGSDYWFSLGDSGFLFNNLFAKNTGFSRIVQVDPGYSFVSQNTFAYNSASTALAIPTGFADVQANLFANNLLAVENPAILQGTWYKNAFVSNTNNYSTWPRQADDIDAATGFTSSPFANVASNDFSLNTEANGGAKLFDQIESPAEPLLSQWSCKKDNTACADTGNTDIGYHHWTPSPSSCSCFPSSPPGSTPTPPSGSTPPGGVAGPGGNVSSGGSPVTPSQCGNNRCEANETEASCEADCKTPLPPGIEVGRQVKECPTLSNPLSPRYASYHLNPSQLEAARKASELPVVTLLSTRIFELINPTSEGGFHAEHTYQIRTSDTQIRRLIARVPIEAARVHSKQPFEAAADGIDFVFNETIDAGKIIRFTFNQTLPTDQCPERPPLLLAGQTLSRKGIATENACSIDSDCPIDNPCYVNRCIANTCIQFQQTPGTPCGFGHACTAQAQCQPFSISNKPNAPNHQSLVTIALGLVVGLIAVVGYYWTTQRNTDTL